VGQGELTSICDSGTDPHFDREDPIVSISRIPTKFTKKDKIWAESMARILNIIGNLSLCAGSNTVELEIQMVALYHLTPPGCQMLTFQIERSKSSVDGADGLVPEFVPSIPSKQFELAMRVSVFGHGTSRKHVVG
jgi:hypothetical protein